MTCAKHLKWFFVLQKEISCSFAQLSKELINVLLLEALSVVTPNNCDTKLHVNI
jgi:hypothetical protein